MGLALIQEGLGLGSTTVLLTDGLQASKKRKTGNAYFTDGAGFLDNYQFRAKINGIFYPT